MRVNLAIDYGNSSVKVAIFDGERLIAAKRMATLNAAEVKALAPECSVRHAIYSTVRAADANVAEAVGLRADDVMALDHNTHVPLSIEYATPATLGHDRIAAAVGAAFTAQGQDCLIVDAGTAMTLDVVTADRRFLGGNISPGMRMRFEALHSHTGRLPLVDACGDIPMIGYDTATAIRSGVALGIAGEIESTIRRVSKQYGDNLKVILTGGDCRLIASLVDADVSVDEHLLMKGLNRILLYNEKI